MSDKTIVTAELREDVGKGASRRLRRSGKVPAVIYGGHRDPVALTVQQRELLHAAEEESFYASVLEIHVGEDRVQKAVVRDIHRHPHKPLIMHIDFMRVSETEAIRMSVPLHFVGEEASPAGKKSGVVIQHQVTDVEISALPKNLPEFIEVDLSKMGPGESVMLSELSLPEGVTIPALAIDPEENDAAVANAIYISESQGTGAAAAAEAEAAAADELAEAGVPTLEEEVDEDEEGESESESKDEE